MNTENDEPKNVPESPTAIPAAEQKPADSARTPMPNIVAVVQGVVHNWKAPADSK